MEEQDYEDVEGVEDFEKETEDGDEYDFETEYFASENNDRTLKLDSTPYFTLNPKNDAWNEFYIPSFIWWQMVQKQH